MAKSKQNKGQPQQGRADKSDEILGIAAEYFLTHGYNGASINEMARDSGISKESIYRYFRSKKGLFEAVIDRELDDYQNSLQAIALDEKGSLRDQLLRTAETVLGVVTTDRNLSMRRLLFQQASHNPEIGRHYWEVGPEPAYRYLEGLFAQHSDRSRISPARLSRYFIAMVLQPPLLERECQVARPFRPKRIAEIAAEAVDDFMRAFLGER